MSQGPVKLSVQPSLYRRGTVFYAKIKHPDGKWKNFNTKEQDRQRALIAAETMQARVDRGLPAAEEGATPAALLTVKELCERYLQERTGHRTKDLGAYRRKMKDDLRYLLYPFLGQARAATLRKADVRAWLTSLREKEGYSPNTIKAAMGRLSAVYTWALAEDVLIDLPHPCRGLRLESGNPSEEHYTLDEIGRFLALPDVPVMLVTALYTGMRRGELRALRWEWIDLDGMIIEVRGSYRGLPKNGRARVVPMHRELVPWLKRWQEKCPATEEGLVFPLEGKKGVKGWRMATPNDTKIDLIEVLRKAGVARIPARPWHAARHSLATHLAKATRGNLDAVGRILGHSGSGAAAVTRGYVHTADLDYLAGELAKLSYRPQAAAGVVDLQQERDKRRGRKRSAGQVVATDLLPGALVRP